MKETSIKDRRVEHEGLVFSYDGKLRPNGTLKVYRIHGDINQ